MKLSAIDHPVSAVKYLVVGIGVLALHIIWAPCALAAVQFGSNYYEFVQASDPFAGANNSWFTAETAAAASTMNGSSGHLATITSKAENDFLISLVPSTFLTFAGAWLGGKAPQGWLEGPETGQPFTYTNWGASEPNNSGYAYMNIGAPFAGIAKGQWADDSGVQGFPDPSADPVVGYFVEYEGLPGDFNSNGVVDAADYVTWRKGLGTNYTQGDYDTWRAHFGQTAGSGAGLNVAGSARTVVPEPCSLLVATLGLLGMLTHAPRRSAIRGHRISLTLAKI